MTIADGYLHRIWYVGRREPTSETLRELQRAHLLSVPFENVDINPAGVPIVLDVDALYDKVVRRRRGGFCYELNGLFAVLLGELGFDVTRVSGRVSRGAGEFGPEFDHLALVVQIESAYLADVGFGDFSLEPLDLAVDGAQPPKAGGKAFRVDRVGDSEWLTREPKDDGGWDDGYRFDLTPRALSDFAAQCRWFESAEESHFRTRRVCSMATPDGRITLRDSELIVTRGASREITPISGEAEWSAALEKWFGIRLDARLYPPDRP
ncbi:MAG: arylamine N-acetyltransferase [Mycobacteriales bacterium]